MGESNRPDAGLMPDVMVRVTPKDVGEGRDPQVAAVLKLVTRASAGPRRGGDER